MKGDIRYQLLIDGRPDPDLTGELVEAVVSESIDQATTFRVRFACDICDGTTKWADEDRLTPGLTKTLSVVVVLDGESTCICHGLILEREIHLVRGGPGSWLEVRGTDRRVVMDRDGSTTKSHEGAVSGIVQEILERHKFKAHVEKGLTARYTERKQTLNQHGSDLKLISELAGQHGLFFWITWEVKWSVPRPEVVEHAHFESSPPRNQGMSFAAALSRLAPGKSSVELKINADPKACTVSSFKSSRKSEVPNQSGSILRVNLDTGELDRTQVREPTDKRLGDRPPAPTVKRRVLSAGSVEDAQRRQEAALNDASWNTTANVETSAHELGTLVRPHEIVTVSGASSVDDGAYFVRSVVHTITPTDHKMAIEMLRNAVGKG